MDVNLARFLLNHALQYRDEGDGTEFRGQIAVASLAYVQVGIFHH